MCSWYRMLFKAKIRRLGENCRKIYLAMNFSHYPDTLWCYCKKFQLRMNTKNVRRWQLPHRMIQHHGEKQQKQMMNAQKTVVWIFSHLSRWWSPNCCQTRQHNPARETARCQKHQPKNILCGRWRMINDDDEKITTVVSLTSSLSFAQLISRCFSS